LILHHLNIRVSIASAVELSQCYALATQWPYLQTTCRKAVLLSACHTSGLTARKPPKWSYYSHATQWSYRRHAARRSYRQLATQVNVQQASHQSGLTAVMPHSGLTDDMPQGGLTVSLPHSGLIQMPREVALQYACHKVVL